jgi:hypothetical protein
MSFLGEIGDRIGRGSNFLSIPHQSAMDRKMRSAVQEVERVVNNIQTQSWTDSTWVTLTETGSFADEEGGDAVQVFFTIPDTAPIKLGVVQVTVQPSNGPGLFAEVGIGGGFPSFHMWMPSTLGGGAGAWPQLLGPGTFQVTVRHEFATAGDVTVFVSYETDLS